MRGLRLLKPPPVSSTTRLPDRTAPEVLPPSEAWLVAQACAVIVFSSWAFGGSYAWGPDWILAIVAAGLPILALRYRETHAIAWRPFLVPLTFLFFCAISTLNPSHTALRSGGWVARPGWIAWLPTTVDRGRTIGDARMWLAALMEGALVMSIVPSRRAVKVLWSIAALNGVVLAVVGTFFRFAGADRALGLVDAPEPSYFFATFFYKNHWAAYGALTTVAAFALVVTQWRAALAGRPEARSRALLYSVVGLLTVVTLPLPGSRAGAALAIVLVVGFIAILTATARDRLGWRANGAIWLTGALALVILVFGVFDYAPTAEVDAQRTREELATALAGGAADLRLELDRDTWHMAKARPWFGWGPGCYEIVFPVFQGAYLRSANGAPQARFEAAHDDWLQLLAEVGFIGASLFVIPLGFVAWNQWKAGSRSGRSALAGVGLIALYAAFDFPFHNPAVLVLWTILFTTAGRLGRG